MSPALRLVVFDVDGTLIDSQAHIVRAMAEAFAAIGAPAPDRATVLAVVGLSLPMAVASLAPARSEAEQGAMVAAYRASYGRQRAEGRTPPYPGAADLLARLAARDDMLLGLATGMSRRGVEHMLDAEDWRGHFVTRQVADDHPSKPHPAMLKAALAEAGVEPAAAIMVGDTEYDIEMGRAAGVATIGVGWGYHPVDRLARAGADRIVTDFAALEAALDEIGRQG